jgi:hypothetical protein
VQQPGAATHERDFAMSEPIDSMSHHEFLTLVRAGIFTDEEIVGKVAQYPGRPLKERTELVQAISEIKGGPITGPIRTALRALDGLPPVPGD